MHGHGTVAIPRKLEIPDDRRLKVPLYARHGVPEVWLFDLEHSRLHIYTAPSERSYLECRILAEPGLIAPAALPQCAVDMTGIV